MSTGAGVTVSEDGIVTGNTYDKYGSTNPVGAAPDGGLRARPRRAARAAPTPSRCSTSAAARACSCSAGRSASARARVVGIDLEEDSIQAGWAQRTAPNLEYRVMRAESLPFAENEFDLATAIEVLEHVPDPEHTLAEMARCAERHLLVSVPREPLWRMLNMARGAYWRELGNTPGHLNHWSKRCVRAICSRATARWSRSARRSPGRCCLSGSEEFTPGPRPGRLVGHESGRRQRLPAARRGARESCDRSYGSGARILSIGIAATGLLTFAYFSIASHVLGEAAAARDRRCCGR